MTIARTPTGPRRRTWSAVSAVTTVAAMLASLLLLGHSGAAAATPAGTAPARAAAANCSVGQSGAAVPTLSSGTSAVRTTIGVAKAMGVPLKGQIIAVMVMFQESSIRNLANDGTSTQNASWPAPGRDYWISVTKLSLKYPHDKFGSRDGAHDTDSVGLYQQRPAYGWGNYGSSSGTTDPEGVIQRLLDPRWEAMAFFGGPNSAAPTSGLLDVNGWESMAPTYAANAVQGSNLPTLYAQWEGPATTYVNNNQDMPTIGLPWYPGGGAGALACTSIPVNPALGEAGHNPMGSLDGATIDGTSIRLSGWSLDPDAINGLTQVHFYDRGPFGTFGYPNGTANQPREDVNRVFNVLGNFGFVATIPWNGPGQHEVCAYGINVGRGTANPRLACRDVYVPGPLGNVDSVVVSAPRTITVSGWAADPAAPRAREQVHIYVTGPDGTFGTPGTFTGVSRPDVAAAVPWAGGAQGFTASVASAGNGENRVCVYAINVNPPWTNPSIGCRTVMLRDTPPIGNYESMVVSGNTATVTGWSLDPNQPAVSIGLHLYVNSNIAPITANLARPDVNAVLAVPGNHGFQATVGIPQGTSEVCLYALGTNGTNTALGCRTASPEPIALAAEPRTLVQSSVPPNADPTRRIDPVPTGPAVADSTGTGSPMTTSTTASPVVSGSAPSPTPAHGIPDFTPTGAGTSVPRTAPTSSNASAAAIGP